MPEEKSDAAPTTDAAAFPEAEHQRVDRSERVRELSSDSLSSDAPSSDAPSSADDVDDPIDGGDEATAAARKRRRGSRGGKNRRKSAKAGETSDDQPELPDPPHEGQVSSADSASDQQPDPEISARGRRPIATSLSDRSESDAETADQRPVRPRRTSAKSATGATSADAAPSAGSDAAPSAGSDAAPSAARDESPRAGGEPAPRGGRGRRGRTGANETRREAAEPSRDAPRDKNGRPVGRYLMCVHTQPGATQIAVLEGRSLIEHYVSRPTDQAAQIHGNLYLGRVQNVLPGMEAAFIDIGTPKNAVLYRSDVSVDLGDVEGATKSAKKRQNDSRIEDILRNSQLIVCQVTKNPIGAKGARLTQDVSLPGRFVVLIPNSDTYGISKRLGDDERKRLRRILDEVRPEGHGLIVRTAAEGATEQELRADVVELGRLWSEIEAKAKRSKGPTLLHREPDLAVRVIREEFNRNYRGVVLDDPELFREVRDYVERITPELADRVEFYDTAAEGLPLYERHHVHEQLHKAIDRKVWLPSGGSLIIERTEALTVIDVNTGKNVGSSNLEETVFRNNLEAAEEIARQLRLRDIGGIIVIDFIDMEIRANREAVMTAFRSALSRDKTRSQVFEISELGLVEMTRKRISEGLVESLSGTCPTCGGRGITFDQDLLH